MEEPQVIMYDSSLDVDTRESMGAINLKEHGMVIAIQVINWDSFGEPQGWTHYQTPLNLKFARIAAFLTDSQYEDQPVLTELNLIDCRSVLTETEMANSSREFQNGVNQGVMSCIDPDNAILSKYNDDLGSG